MADSTEQAPFRLRYAALSDVGRHRKENQDSGYASERLLVIADGVGGAAYGDVASSTAVHLLRRLDAAPEDEMLSALAGAMHRIHDRLAEMVEQDEELNGTSTTVTAALFDGGRIAVAHVGDSRAYLLRDGRVSQLTKDHTFVQTLVDEGRISEADSRVHPHRNIILRAVDGVHDAEPDLFHVELRLGDRIMLCSDGCSGAVSDPDIGTLLAEGTVDSAAVALVEAALDGGTTDNVTVIVAEVVSAEDVDDAETNAAVSLGPMLVGAAAEQPRRGVLSRTLFRNRQSDTGELEPVPEEPVDPKEPVDPEELRYAPRPPRRRAGLVRVLLALVALGAVGLALTGAYTWSQKQYFVAADGPYVAIYRGVQTDLPVVELASVYEPADNLQVDQLSSFNRAKVQDGIVADDLADARRIVEELTRQLRTCPDGPSPSASASPSPSPSPSASPDADADGSPAASRVTDPSPRATTDAEPVDPKPGGAAGTTPAPRDDAEGTDGDAGALDCPDGAAGGTP